jgi:hypothetical protein
LCKAIKRKRPGWLTAGVRVLHAGAQLTLQPRQRPACKSGSGKSCSIHHIVLV